MPVYLRHKSYVIFFWTHEDDEPIHFRITEGAPSASSTKVWVLSDGSFLLANNSSKIPRQALNRIFRIMQDNFEEYRAQWEIIHGPARYYRWVSLFSEQFG